jgi:hypothetical protein
VPASTPAAGAHTAAGVDAGTRFDRWEP